MQLNIEESIGKTADFCRNFPPRPTSPISRQSFLEHISNTIESSSKIVFIEGQSLSGKSVLLADYMWENHQNTIGVFLSPGDNYFYTAQYVRLAIYEQAYWILNAMQPNYNELQDAEFMRILLQLQRKAKNKPITFIIDGLADSLIADPKITKEILGLLPFGQNEFRFIISGSPETLTTVGLEKHKPKTVPLLPISTEDANAYFSECTTVAPDEVNRIRHFCRGVIGQMARFKDLILSGVPVSTLLDEKEGTLKKILEFEWNLVSKENGIIDVLGYVAFATSALNIIKIASLTEKNDVHIRGIIADCRFLEVDEDSKIVAIRSEEEKRFIKEKLNHMKQKFMEHFVSELLKDPHGEDAVRNLPLQLLNVGRHGDLIQRLDEGHFVRLLENDKSLRSLKRHCELGYSAAKIVKNDAAEIRFALTNSVITGLTFSVGTKSEIEARLKLGEKEMAVALALAAPTSEERLQLLATAAKAFHSSNLIVPRELREQIKSLVNEVDFSSLGYLAPDIACDLLVVDFSLAMEVFEKAIAESNDKMRGSALDEAGASITGNANSEESGTSLGKVHSRLSEHHRQRFADAVATLVERSNPDDLLMKLKSTEEKHQLFVVKQWLKRKRREPDAYKIADHALNLALGDLSRPPRIQDFREIAVVLPHIQEREHTEKLVKRIKAQLHAQLSHGTNVEYVRLQMSLIRASYSVEPEGCDLALIELFSEIHEIAEVSIRAACWAWMLYGIQKLSDPTELDGRTSVVSEITSKLIESIELLLESSADHYETARNAIYALARANPTLAMQLIGKINTRERRDKALATLVRELVVGKAYVDNPGLLLTCISKIELVTERESTILRCLSLIAKESEKGEIKLCNKGILNLWRSIRVALQKFAAGVSVYRIMVSTGYDSTAIETIAGELDDVWPDVMVDWVRTDMGYGLVRDIAKADRELATRWLKKVTDERRQSKMPSKALGNVLYLTVRLAIASFSVIATNECDNNDPQFSRLAFLIEAVPLPEYRMALWCDLGISLHYRGKRSLSRLICSEFVQSALQQNYKNNDLVRDVLIEIAAPFLYLNHPPSASILLSRIRDPLEKERACADICRTILRKRSINEPYKRHDIPGYEIDSESVASILDVLKEINTDSLLLPIIEDLCESLGSRKNKARIRRPQVKDFLIAIDDLIEKKLPDARNIKHDGYKIAAKAHVLKARATFESVPVKEWDELHAGAQAITNVADRVVVLTMVGTCAKNKGPFGNKTWFDSVKADIAKIPSDFDRIDRYSWVADLMGSIDKHQSILLLQEAMSLSNYLDDEGTALEKQKRILDLAHSIDEGLVDKIIDLADKDDAKAPIEEKHLEHIKLKERRKDLASDPSCFDIKSLTPEELAEICYDNHASLAGGRIFLKPVEDFRKLAEAATQMSMSIAFPIWSWIIENASGKAGIRSKGEKLLQNTYEAACHSAELTLALIGKSRQGNADLIHEGNGLIRPGERDEVFERIRRWAATQDGKTIRISDPYFGPEDLDVVHCIAESAPRANIRILTSKKHLKDVISAGMFDDVFRSAWKDLCELPPPSTEVVVVALGTEGGHPVHDRWIFSDESGLRLGGSTNSMGYFRVSEISTMDASASREKCTVIDELLDRKKKEWFGEKLTTSSFDLD